jgi:hypothetical protein
MVAGARRRGGCVVDVAMKAQDYAAKLAAKWAVNGFKVAIEGAIREALAKAAEVAEDGLHECDGACHAPEDCGKAIRALGAKP